MFEEEQIEILETQDLFEDEDVVIVKAMFKNLETNAIEKRIDVAIKNLKGDITEYHLAKSIRIPSSKADKKKINDSSDDEDYVYDVKY